MNPKDLRAKCEEILARPISTDFVVLVLRGSWGKRNTRLLAGKGSPRGEILSDYFGRGPSGVCVGFKPSEILAWLDKVESETE